jgi:hypothetical protein
MGRNDGARYNYNENPAAVYTALAKIIRWQTRAL